MFHVFPDADFCLYRDYPLRQLVFTHHYALELEQLEYLRAIDPNFSCMYLWINQFLNVLNNTVTNDEMLTRNLQILVDSGAYRNMKTACNFSRRLELCQLEEVKDSSLLNQTNSHCIWDIFSLFFLSN